MRQPRLSFGVLCFMMILSVWQDAPSTAVVPPPGPIAQDLAGLVQAASLIIVGEVIDIRPGRIAGPPEDRLQFNDVHVRVEKSLKGKAATVIIVEQVAMPAGEVFVGLGPPYRRGERYLLFLTPGAGQRYVSVPQGRYLHRGGRMHALQPGPVADRLQGVAETALMAQIEALVGLRR